MRIEESHKIVYNHNASWLDKSNEELKNQEERSMKKTRFSKMMSLALVLALTVSLFTACGSKSVDSGKTAAKF